MYVMLEIHGCIHKHLAISVHTHWEWIETHTPSGCVARWRPWTCEPNHKLRLLLNWNNESCTVPPNAGCMWLHLCFSVYCIYHASGGVCACLKPCLERYCVKQQEKRMRSNKRSIHVSQLLELLVFWIFGTLCLPKDTLSPGFPLTCLHLFSIYGYTNCKICCKNVMWRYERVFFFSKYIFWWSLYILL